MRARLWTTLIGVLWVGAVVMAALVVRTFDQDPVNAPPPGFVFASVGDATGRWFVRGDRTGRHLAFAPEGASAAGQALALLPDAVVGRFRASVRVRLGEGARRAGIVWHYRDPDNFHQVVLDLVEQEIALVRTVRGTRITLEDEDDLELDPAAWHAITVRQDRESVRIYLGGIGVMRSRTGNDEAGGRVGVWSAGATAVSFDDLRLDTDPGRDR